jgi:hydrogenase nickel incorporation protein HypA/HybF
MPCIGLDSKEIMHYLSLLMHEMAIAQSLIAILREEMDKHGLTRLTAVRVKHGRLAGVVPEALEMSFQVATVNTPMQKVELTLEEVPLRLKCGACGAEFSPEGSSLLLMPCPECGEEIGHEVLEGKELYIDGISGE